MAETITHNPRFFVEELRHHPQIGGFEAIVIATGHHEGRDRQDPAAGLLAFVKKVEFGMRMQVAHGNKTEYVPIPIPSSIRYDRALRTEDAFGRALKQLRHEKSVSQAGLAAKCGCDISSISKLERGLTQPSLHFLLLLARGLGAPPQDLLKKTLENEPDIRMPS